MDIKVQPNKVMKSSLQTAFITMVLYLTITCVFSLVLLQGKISESWMNLIVYLTLAIGTFLGMIINRKIDKSWNIISLVCAVVTTIVILLIINITINNADFHNAFIKILCIVAGAGMSALMIHPSKKRVRKKRHHR